MGWELGEERLSTPGFPFQKRTDAPTGGETAPAVDRAVDDAD